MNEGDEQVARLRAEEFAKNLEFEIALDPVAGDGLAIFEQVGVTATRRGSAGFLQFVVSGISETEEEALEVFV
jgi:hypothetical protein